ncbi:MAG: SPOR domain-containing protein [Magnetococcus sp. YQC-5]
MLVIGSLVVLNILVLGMSWMGKGFKTPENEIWRGPVMPGKLLELSPLPKGEVSATPKPTVTPPVEKPKVDKPVETPVPVVKQAAVVAKPPPPPVTTTSIAPVSGKFVVQIGSFALNLGVDSLLEQLTKAGLNPRVEMIQERVSLNNVQAGPYKTLESAKEAEAKLKAGSIKAQVEESWEGYIISLNKSLLLGQAVEELERIRSLGVAPLRVVKVDVDLVVRKVLIGPYESKERAKKMSAEVAAMGFAAPVVKTWPFSNALP